MRRVIGSTSLGRCRSGFLGGLAGFLKKLAFGADPVFERIAGSALALKINFISALGDFFLGGKFFGGRGFTFH